MLVAGIQVLSSAREKAAADAAPSAERIALRFADGNLSVKEGDPDAKLESLRDGVSKVAVSGNRVGAVTGDGSLLVKEGSLGAPFVELASDAADVALSGDRVGYINTAGVAFVKKPDLQSPWVQVAENVKQLALSGRRMAVVQRDGTTLAKEGGLEDDWIRVTGGVNQVSMSGDRFAVLDFGNSASIKEGTLTGPWTRVATDAKSVVLQGQRVGVLKRDGTALVKEGDLSTDWVPQTTGASELVLRDDRIGVLTDGTAAVKEGPLNAGWTLQGVGVASMDMAVQERPVTQFGAKCDGKTDDTKAIQTTLNTAKANDTVVFPESQTCRYSKSLIVKNKKNLVIQGGGKDSTRLEATNPAASAIEVHHGQNITLQDFQIESLNSETRDTRNPATGIWVQDSKDVDIARVSIRRSASAGIFVGKSRDIKVTYSDVQHTLADGIHLTGGTSNATLQYNQAYRTGDDSYASVSYQGTQQKNENINILDNTSRYSNASGVTVEGSKGVQVERNSIYQSKVAGMRITIAKSYYSRGVYGVTFVGNTITRSPSSSHTDHPAILLYINYKEKIHQVTIDQNKINDPESRFGVRLLRSGEGVIEQIGVESNGIVSDKFGGGDCVSVSADITRPVIKLNTLNERPCSAQIIPVPKPKPKPKPKPRAKKKKPAKKKKKAKKKKPKKKKKKKKKKRR